MAVSTIVTIAMTVISIGMQIAAAQSARRRAARLKREAAERADQAKGFMFVTEGEAAPLPIFYGRNKIGGIRVYHALSSNYVFAEANAGAQVFCPYIDPNSKKVYLCDANGNITLSTAPSNPSDYYVFPRGGERWDSVGTIPGTFFSGVTYALPEGDYAYYPKYTAGVPNELPPFPIFPVNDPNGKMLSSQDGTKREYFAVEQALCFGPINGVVHLLVEGKDWDHPNFSESIRIIVHKDGGNADTLMVANHQRNDAKFTHAAHMAGIFKLNRDDPQFNGGAPEVQAIIEGMLVRTIVGDPGNYELSSNKVYSNNPAYCLLDYLTNTVYGRGVPVSQLDLDSFKRAAEICDIPVSRFDSTLGSLKLEGDYWRRKGVAREYRLFECNIGLSSAKPVRENVELLLETMGMAELVWSAGKYSLQLMHPMPVVDGWVFNADEIGYFSATNEYKRWDDTQWVDDVVAHVTDDDIVRARDITFSWPGAQSRQNLVTVKFNNEAKGFSEDTATWPKRYSAIHTQFLAEDGGVPLETEAFEAGITDYYHALAKAEQRVRVSRRSTNYQLTLIRKHSNLETGDLVRIESGVLGVPGEVVRVESVKLEENGDVTLEAYSYNCLDLAWNAKDTEVVEVPNIYSEDIGQATGLHFNPSVNTLAGSSGTLYWTAADDSAVIDYTVMYSTEAAELVTKNTSWTVLGKVRGTFMELPSLIGGVFTLAVVANTATRSAPFKSYYTGSGWPLLQIGVAPKLIDGRYFAALTLYRRDVGVPSAPIGGSYNFRNNTFIEVPSGWSVSKPSGAAQLYVSTAVAESDANLQDSGLDWSTPAISTEDPNSVYLSKPLVGVVDNAGVLDYSDAFGEVVVIANAADVTAASEFQVAQQVNCVVTVNTAGQYRVTAVTGNNAYAVIAVKYAGVEVTRTLTISVLRAIDVKDLTPPPDVTAIDISVGMTNVFVSLPSLPSYSQGGGHYATTMYYTEGSLLFEDAKAMGEFRGTDHIIASDLGRTLKLWFKFRTQDGVESVNAYGPLDATTGLIDGNDLNPLILESLEIADGSITSVKLADNAVEMAKIADGAVVSNKIAANAITAGKIAANAVTADSIAASAITSDKIAANSITAGKLAAGSIAVGTAAIAEGAIVRAMIGNAAIDSARIANAAIGSAKIADTIQSDNFSAGYTGWRLRRDMGSIEVSQLTVYDGAGNVVLSSGGIPYTFVSGRPTSLGGINSAEGSKLSGIEAGATKGASFGVNIDGQITASNASTYIANAAIGAAQIGSIALVGTSNFSVKTSTSGARMEMDSQAIKVFDANGVKRVQLGNLDV